jgi:hypothetical protein
MESWLVSTLERISFSLRTAAAVSSQEVSIPKISMPEGIFLVECLLDCVNTILQCNKTIRYEEGVDGKDFFHDDNHEVDSIP